MQIVSGGATHVGCVRSNNEDCFRIVEPLQLFVLADGMGGEAHGEIASSLAVETVVKHCYEGEDNPAITLYGPQKSTWSDKTKRLCSAVHLANNKILQSAQEHPEQKGMGATLTAAWIDGNCLSVSHVGDSRAYLLRGGSLQQLTCDHSLVAEQVRHGILSPVEAERSEMQSVLLRALGSEPQIEIDTEEHAVFARDILLLCSDGLTRMVIEPEIAGTLQVETDANRAAQKLVELANDAGGADNITVIVVRIGAVSKGWFSWLRPRARRNAGNGAGGK